MPQQSVLALYYFRFSKILLIFYLKLHPSGTVILRVVPSTLVPGPRTPRITLTGSGTKEPQDPSILDPSLITHD